MHRFLLSFSLMMGSLSLLAQENDVTPEWLQGEWEGTGYQIDGQTWEIILEAEKGEEVVIRYPDLGCSGYWLMEQPGRTKLHFKEQIISGLGVCDQGGDVFVKKINKNKLRLTYYLYSYSQEPIAKAVIKRMPDSMNK
jgi:hypothetical protein